MYAEKYWNVDDSLEAPPPKGEMTDYEFAEKYWNVDADLSKWEGGLAAWGVGDAELPPLEYLTAKNKNKRQRQKGARRREEGANEDREPHGNLIPTEPVENPGLIESEHRFTGTIKHAPSSKTGFGFIKDDNVAARYGGKDAFLHRAVCPWIEQMNLKVGDTVHFNIKLNEKQAPQVKRIVKAT